MMSVSKGGGAITDAPYKELSIASFVRAFHLYEKLHTRKERGGGGKTESFADVMKDH